MKKTIALLLTAVLMTTAACGATQKDASGAGQEAAAQAEDAGEADAAEDAGDPAFGEETSESANAEQSSEDVIACWTKGSAVAESIITYVNAVSDESSDSYVPVEDRIAVFDFDGTLYGELYPTYFDTCLMMYRALHDENYEAPEEIKAYAESMEEALYSGQPEPDSKLSSAQCSAEMFKGLTYEEYCDYIRKYMETPAWGFEGMTYGEGFYQPMVSLVEYLADHDFTIFISSGSERTIVRELIKGGLDQWIPSDRVIGSTFSFEATGQGDKDGRKYTYAADDEVLIEGNLLVKNQKTNKVFSIINEIGKTPVLVFGNSSGDLAMGQYVVQKGGKGYMLLCDDTERDYGKLDVAEKFAGECAQIGLETVSMKNDFATIYGDGVVKTEAPAETVTPEETQEETEDPAETDVPEETPEETQEEEEQVLEPAA